MSGWDDLPDEMRGERIDEHTMDQLLRGRMAPDDAPPGYSDVASVLLAAASLPEEEELTMEIDHVVAARAAIGRGSAARPAGTRRLTAGLIVAGALVAIPGLAAANVLPDAAQHALAKVLDKAGITVPGNEDHPTGPTGPASTGTEISGIATTTDETGVAKGAAISSVASGGKSQAGQHGQAGTSSGSTETAPVTTPNSGGTGTGDTASGGQAESGAATADQSSGDRSALGSANAQAPPIPTVP